MDYRGGEMMEHKQIKEQLAINFKDLILEYPFEKITIKMITDRVGVIRPTFYNHFADKYELLEWICYKDIFESLEVLTDSKMPKEAVKLLFVKLEQQKNFYIQIAKVKGQNSFEQIFCQQLQSLFERSFELKNKSTNITHPFFTSTMITKYYAQGLTFLILEWLEQGGEVCADEMAKYYYRIASHSLEDLLLK